MSMWLFLTIVAVVAMTSGGLCSRRSGDSRGGDRLPRTDPDRESVRALRQRVEELTNQVERLEEEQRFLTRLLEERPPRRTRASRADNVSAVHARAEESV